METEHLKQLIEEQRHLNLVSKELYENFNVLLDNLKSKIDNQDIVVENQSRIISNQDIIVNNQLNIIKNQKLIGQNQLTLAVILKTQVRVLAATENLKGNPNALLEMQELVSHIYEETREAFEKGLLNLQKIE